MRQTEDAVTETAVGGGSYQEDSQGEAGRYERTDDEHDGQDEHSVGGAHHVAEQSGTDPARRPRLLVVVERRHVEGDEGDEQAEHLQPGGGPAQ